MLRIAVVEDEAQYRQVMEEHIARFAQETGIPCRVDAYPGGNQLLENYQSQYDVLFLDIQMGGLDGMETAQEIRNTDPEVIIIFVTNLAQYAIRGYSVRATNFLLKPVGYYALSEELKKAAQRQRRSEERYLQLKTEEGLQRVEISQITYVETMNRHVLVHAGDKTYASKELMRDLENRLESEGFFRCHNAYLVNLAHVEGVSQTSVTVGGESLLLSRYKRKPFLDTLARYMGKQL